MYYVFYEASTFLISALMQFCSLARNVGIICESASREGLVRRAFKKKKKTSHDISVNTFHIKRDSSRGQGKIKVGQNNEQILYEDCMAAGAISWRHVTFSISTGGGDKSPERKD